MKKATQIRSVETLACDAGWRNYHFVKIMTEDGIVGWSEYDEGFGAPGVTAASPMNEPTSMWSYAFHAENFPE